jgi:hypothetical protein|tara:strand:- start:2076 stop:2282 length:207 start_codon:yes stop_codon:yes gene_type:complete
MREHRLLNSMLIALLSSCSSSSGSFGISYSLPPGCHFHGDTNTYRTTMTILMLEVYYWYAPIGGGKVN